MLWVLKCKLLEKGLAPYRQQALTNVRRMIILHPLKIRCDFQANKLFSFVPVKIKKIKFLLQTKISSRETANTYIKYGRVNSIEKQTNQIQLKPDSTAVNPCLVSVSSLHKVKQAGLADPSSYGFVTSISRINS